MFSWFISKKTIIFQKGSNSSRVSNFFQRGGGGGGGGAIAYSLKKPI